MSDSPSTPAPAPADPGVAAPATPPRRRIDRVRVVGAVLLLAAVALWFRDARARRDRENGAAAVRYVAGAAVRSVGILPVPADGRPGGIYEPCSPAALSNVLSRLAAAETAAPPRDMEALDRRYDLVLVLDDHTRAAIRVARHTGEDEAWASFREPRPGNDAGAPAFADLPPARVTGLGALLDAVDSGDPQALSLGDVRAVAVPVALPPFRRVAGENGFTEESVSDAAAGLRAVAALPPGQAFALDATDPAARGRAVPLPPAELCALLAAAEPVAPPEGSIEGTDHRLLLVVPGPALLALRATVADAEPDDALVGFLDDGATASAPARVPGLGRLLRSLAAPAP